MGSSDPKGEKSIGVAGFWRGKYLEQMMLASNSWGSLEPFPDGRLDLDSWAGEVASAETHQPAAQHKLGTSKGESDAFALA